MERPLPITRLTPLIRDFTRHTHTHTHRLSQILRPQDGEGRRRLCPRAQCPAPRDHPTPEPRGGQEARRRRGALKENERLTFLAGAGDEIPSTSLPQPTTTPASACDTFPPDRWSCPGVRGGGLLVWQSVGGSPKKTTNSARVPQVLPHHVMRVRSF